MLDRFDNGGAFDSAKDDAGKGYYAPVHRQVRSAPSYFPPAESLSSTLTDATHAKLTTSAPFAQASGGVTGMEDHSPLPQLPSPVIPQTATWGFGPKYQCQSELEIGEEETPELESPTSSTAWFSPVQVLPNKIMPTGLACKASTQSSPSPILFSLSTPPEKREQQLYAKYADARHVSTLQTTVTTATESEVVELTVTQQLEESTATMSPPRGTEAATYIRSVDIFGSGERRSTTVARHPLDNAGSDEEEFDNTRHSAKTRRERTFSPDFDTPGRTAEAEEMQELRIGKDCSARLPVMATLSGPSSSAAVAMPVAAASTSVMMSCSEDANGSHPSHVDPSVTFDRTTAGFAKNEFGVVSVDAEKPAPPTPYPVTSTSSLSDWSTAPRLGFPAPTSSNVASAEAESLLRRDADERKREDKWYRLCRGVSLLASASPETIVRLRSAAREFGIPHHLRAVMWLTLTGMALKVDENEYFCAKLLRRNGYVTGPNAGAIAADVQRTFPGHPYFSERDVGIYKLTNILHALCWRNPLLSYCQSFNFLAAFLLLILDDEERVFWLLVYIFEQLLPNDFYGETLLGANVEQAVLERLVQQKLPRVAAKFHAAGLQVHTLVANWMMSMFVNIFPPATLLRLWDYLLCRTTNPGERTPAHLEITLAVLKYLDSKNLLVGEDAGELLIALRDQTACLYDAAAVIRLANTLAISPDELHQLRREAKPAVMQHMKEREKARASEQERRLAQELLQFSRNAALPTSNE